MTYDECVAEADVLDDQLWEGKITLLQYEEEMEALNKRWVEEGEN